MKKVLILLVVSIGLSACIAKGEYIRPSDALIDKETLIGTTGRVSGFLTCHSDYCTIYEKKSGLGMAEGSQIVVKTDSLSREDKKFVFTKCPIGEPCAVMVSGKFIKGALNNIALNATTIEKLGMTGLKGMF